MKRLAAIATILLPAAGGAAALGATSNLTVSGPSLRCSQDGAAATACPSTINLADGHSLTVSVPSANTAPAITLSGGRITWPAQASASDYKGAWSDAPRSSASRTTHYADLGNVTAWTPTGSQLPPCGQTYYYGVASEGPSGERWSTTEVAINGPSCALPMQVGLTGGWGQTSADDMRAAGLTLNRMDASTASGGENPGTYITDGVQTIVIFPGATPSGGYSTSGVQSINISSWATGALTYYQANCTQGISECPAVEVLNEPDGSWYWGTGANSQANADAYAKLLQAVWTTFHNALGSAAPKILGYYSSTSYSSWGSRVWNNTADINVNNYVDGITVHPYGGCKTSNGNGGNDALQANPDSSSLGDRNSVTAAHTATNKRVWITEVGWPTDPGAGCGPSGGTSGDSEQWIQAAQASNIWAFVQWARQTGYVHAIIYYEYETGSGPADYGVVNRTTGKKLGWTALQQAAANEACTVCQ